MRPIFGEAERQRLRRHHARWRWGMILLAAAALTAILLLILLTDTLSAPRTELAAVAVSTVAGWVVLYGVLFKLLPDRREEAHAAILAGEQPEPVEGTLTLTDQRVQIAGSITARRVEMAGPEGVRRLLVCDSRAAALEKAAPRRVYAVHGYVAGWEETE